MSESTVLRGLVYDVTGEGPPVLLIHAGVTDRTMWDEQVALLSGRYRVIRYGMRGFGESPAPSGRYCHYEDAALVLEHTQDATAHVVGASFGALVALDLALARPDLVRSLVLVAPVASGWEPASPAVLSFFKAEEEALAKGDLDLATEHNLRMWVDGPGRTPSDTPPALRERVRVMQYRIFSQTRPKGSHEVELDPPAWGRLAEVRAPTLIVVGERDHEELGRVADHLSGIPGSRKTAIGEAGHLPSLQTPEAFNRILLEFLMNQ